MERTFNAQEIFEMAIDIERQGRAFYQKASDSFDDQRLKSLLHGLAEMEREHEEIFISLKDQCLSSEEYAQGYDPDGVAASYLGAMTSGRVFDRKLAFTGSESIEDVLNKGIEAEKNSILFYTGLKHLVPEGLGRENVDRIIGEEMKHVLLLSDMLASVTG
jgi:rubrerythrin